MRKGLPRIVTLLWLTVIVVVAGLTLLLISNTRGDQPEEVPTTTSTITASPSPSPSPTPSPSPIPPTHTPIPPTSIPPSHTPEIIRPQIIGYSVAGRPLEVYQFGSGPIEKMIIAGIHGGNEWNTVILADEMITYLETHPEIIPIDHTLFYLRVFNPDGLARSKGIGGRANDNNVDLNRNFPSNWQADWPRAGCWNYNPINGGTGPASEPETKALIEFVESHNLKAFISYHSAVLGIFPGGQPPDDGSLALAKAVASVSDYPYPPIDTGCGYTGQLVDWISDQGIPGVDIELTNHDDSDFGINLAILSVFLDWSYPDNE